MSTEQDYQINDNTQNILLNFQREVQNAEYHYNMRRSKSQFALKQPRFDGDMQDQSPLERFQKQKKNFQKMEVIQNDIVMNNSYLKKKPLIQDNRQNENYDKSFTRIYEQMKIINSDHFNANQEFEQKIKMINQIKNQQNHPYLYQQANRGQSVSEKPRNYFNKNKEQKVEIIQVDKYTQKFKSMKDIAPIIYYRKFAIFNDAFKYLQQQFTNNIFQLINYEQGMFLIGNHENSIYFGQEKLYVPSVNKMIRIQLNEYQQLLFFQYEQNQLNQIGKYLIVHSNDQLMYDKIINQLLLWDIQTDFINKNNYQNIIQLINYQSDEFHQHQKQQQDKLHVQQIKNQQSSLNGIDIYQMNQKIQEQKQTIDNQFNQLIEDSHRNSLSNLKENERQGKMIFYDNQNNIISSPNQNLNFKSVYEFQQEDYQTPSYVKQKQFQESDDDNLGIQDEDVQQKIFKAKNSIYLTKKVNQNQQESDNHEDNNQKVKFKQFNQKINQEQQNKNDDESNQKENLLKAINSKNQKKINPQNLEESHYEDNQKYQYRDQFNKDDKEQIMKVNDTKTKIFDQNTVVHDQDDNSNKNKKKNQQQEVNSKVQNTQLNANNTKHFPNKQHYSMENDFDEGDDDIDKTIKLQKQPKHKKLTQNIAQDSQIQKVNQSGQNQQKDNSEIPKQTKGQVDKDETQQTTSQIKKLTQSLDPWASDFEPSQDQKIEMQEDIVKKTILKKSVDKGELDVIEIPLKKSVSIIENKDKINMQTKDDKINQNQVKENNQIQLQEDEKKLQNDFLSKATKSMNPATIKSQNLEYESKEIEFQKEFEDKCLVLQKGGFFQKYGQMDMIWPSKIKLQFDKDINTFQWNKNKVFQFQDVVEIVHGRNTPNFKRFSTNDQEKIDSSFSIVLIDRSIDLQAIDQKFKNEFCQALEFVLEVKRMHVFIRNKPSLLRITKKKSKKK